MAAHPKTCYSVFRKGDTTITASKTHRELNENGIDGRGRKVFSVLTIETATSRVIWFEKFETKGGALNWIKWA